MNTFYKIIGPYLGFSILFLNSCSKWIEVDSPQNQLTPDKVFTDSATAISTLGNVYYILANGINTNYNKHASLYTDEYAYTVSNNITEFFNSRISENNGTNSNIWGQFYEAIYACNDILEQVENNSKLTGNAKRILQNEAKFLRAFCYFYLQSLYGEIPLVLTTNVNENMKEAQVPTSIILEQVVKDLNDAKQGLNEVYPTEGKYRANKWSAVSLLSRVYLFMGNWEQAFKESNEVLQDGRYQPLDSPQEVFYENSNEVILQLWRQNGFISDATTLIPSNRTVVPQFTITDDLYSAFENNDLRKTAWIGENMVQIGSEKKIYYFPYKYKNRSSSNNKREYMVAFRAGEQYLIRAEANANLGNLNDAITDLNVIRRRAGLSLYKDPLSKEDCLAAIEKERRIEMFGEWGARFIDLKRSGKLNSLMSAYKNTWVDGSQVFPIPATEIIHNPNLRQNEGY